MTRTIYRTATSLNGYIADEEGSLDWLFAVNQPEPQHQGHFLDSIGVLVQGAATYEWMLAVEDILEKPRRWREFHGDRPTFVFTHRTLPAPEGADIRFVSGRPADVFPDIVKAAGERDIWVMGGGELAGQFYDDDLLTEVQLAVAPVALTGGAPLLPRRIESDRLSLREVEHLAQFAYLTYDITHWDP